MQALEAETGQPHMNGQKLANINTYLPLKQAVDGRSLPITPPHPYSSLSVVLSGSNDPSQAARMLQERSQSQSVKQELTAEITTGTTSIISATK